MRIERLQVYGFGEWQDREWHFQPGFNLVTGQNEAGKTTLMAFIRAILFGFENRKLMHQRYEPRGGGKFGGMLTLVDDAGMQYQVERVGGSKSSGLVKVYCQNGETFGEEQLPYLLGQINDKVFKNIFAFGLTELQQIETLQQDELNSFVYHAGTGSGLSILQVQKQLEDREEYFFKPKASKPVINQTLRLLEEMREPLTALQSQTVDFNQWMEELNQVEQLLAQQADRMRGLESKLRWQENLVSLQEDYQSWLYVEQRLKELPATDDFPEDGLARLEACNEKVRDLTVEHEMLVKEHENIVHKIAQHPVVWEWIHAKEPILSLRDQLSRYEEKLTSLQRVNHALNQCKGEVQSLMKLMGLDWSEEELNAYEVTISIQQEVTDLAEEWQRLSSMSDRNEQLVKEIRQEEDFLSEQGNRLHVWQQALPEWSGEDVQKQQQKVLDWLKVHIQTRGHLQQQKQELEDRLKRDSAILQGWQETEETGFLSRFSLTRWLFPLLAVFLLVTLWTTGELALGLGAFAFFCYLSVQSWRSKRPAAENAQLVAMQAGLNQDDIQLKQVNQELSLLEEQAENLLSPFGLSFSRETILVLEEQEAVQKAKQEQWNKWQEEQRQHEAQLREWQKKEAKLQEAVQEQQQKSSLLEKKWRNWLNSQKMPQSLTPESVRMLFTQLVKAKEKLQELDRLVHEQEQLKQEITHFEDNVRVLQQQLAAVDVWEQTNLIKNLPPSVQKGRLVIHWSEQLNQAEAHRQFCQQQQEKLSEVEQKRTQCEKKLAVFEKEREALLTSAGVLTEDAFRSKSKEMDERKVCLEKRRNLNITFHRMLGDEKRIQEFLSEMAGKTSTQIVDQLNDLNERHQQLQEEWQRLAERKGQLTNQLDKLQRDQELSEKQQEMQQWTAKLEQDAREWAVITIARYMLEETMHVYEKEKQPVVMKHASRYFQQLTDGRYTQLFVPIGEKRIEVERRDGARLDPVYLSRGTVEQLYLAMRFALVEAYRKYAHLPLVLDDILVNFDPQRAKKALEVLMDVSREQQVLFFTCHPHIKEWCQELSVPLHAVQLLPAWKESVADQSFAG